MTPADLEGFRRLKFEGGRFEQPGLPVPVMAELLTYQNLVFRAARAVFFREHPFRQRLPKGFKSRLELRLSKLRLGSVETFLERDTNQIIEDDEFTEAEQYLADLVRAAGARQSLPTLPGFDLSSVTRLGKTLAPDERIVFHPNTNNQAILTVAARHHIATYTYKPSPTLGRLAGRVTEINAAKHTFTLWVNASSSFCTGPFDVNAYLPLLREVLTEDIHTGPEIVVRGTISFSRDGLPAGWHRLTFLSTAHAEHQHLLEGLRKQITELGTLKDTWFDAESKRPSQAVLTVVWDIFESIMASTATRALPIPVAFPTPRGGISLEWITDKMDIDIDILPSGERGDFSYWNKKTGENELEEEVRLSAPKVIAYLQNLYHNLP